MDRLSGSHQTAAGVVPIPQDVAGAAGVRPTLVTLIGMIMVTLVGVPVYVLQRRGIAGTCY